MKKILSTVRGWVVVGVVLGSGVAWGQLRLETEPFTTTNNCIGYKQPNAAPYRSIDWSAECKNRKLHGAGVLSYEFQSNVDKLWKPVIVIGFMNEGVRIGISLQAACVENNKPECLTLIQTEPSGMRYLVPFARDIQKHPKSFSSTNVTEMIERMKAFEADLKGEPTVKTVELLALMKTWSSDSEMTIDKFKNFKPAYSLGGEVKGDDPKVFGRSARGG